MYSVLIVDDEITIRNGIAEQLKLMGIFTSIKTCKNGFEALEYAIDNTPDIIITDIRMPICDGLEFITQYSSLPNESKILILSGYNDFEYVRSALRLGAADYLLKPLEKNALLDKIRELISRIKKDKNKHRRSSTLLWSDAILGDCEALSALADMRGLNRLEKHDNYFVLAVAVLKQEDEVNDEDYLSGLAEVVRDALALPDISSITLTKYATVVSIINTPFSEDEMLRSIESLKSRLDLSQTEVSLRLCLSDCGSELSDINRLYKNALFAAYFCLKQSSDLLAFQSGKESFDYMAFLREATMLKTTLFKAVRSGSAQSVSGVCAQIMEFVQKERYGALAYINFICICISEANLQLATQSRLPNTIIEEILSRIACCRSFEQLEEYFQNQMLQCTKTTQPIAPASYGAAINEIISYIDNNLSADLSVSHICGRFFMNESYFCKLFKSKTGLTFNEYLTGARINSACELLASTNKKIYEISEAVGYKNTKYFATLFKEQTSLSPSEYRNW